MIARVRADWVQGVFEKSLYEMARIDLGLATTPGAVERGIDVLVQCPGEDELARDLLDRAEKEASHPIPVVFNLSSWARRAAPLDEWMAEELRMRSDIPRELAREWIARSKSCRFWMDWTKSPATGVKSASKRSMPIAAIMAVCS